MGKIGFKPLSLELCIFRNEKTGAILILYIDNIIVAAAIIKEINKISAKLMKMFEIKALGEVETFLGL